MCRFVLVCPLLLHSFQPGQVEAVVEAAADEVYHAVGCLGGGKVAAWLGMGSVRLEPLGPCSGIQELAASVGQQTAGVPRLAFVVGDSGIQSVPAETVSVGVGEPQLAVTVGRAEGVPGERNQQERPLVEAHQHQPFVPRRWAEVPRHGRSMSCPCRLKGSWACAGGLPCP